VHKDVRVASTWLHRSAWGVALALDDVREVCATAQSHIDELLQSPSLRRPGPHTAETVNRLRETARVSAVALEGIQMSLPAYQGIRGDGSPIAQIIRITEALLAASHADSDLFIAQPLRALARWHVLATSATDIPDDERGRPRQAHAEVTADPLNSRIDPADAGETLQAVMDCVTRADSSALAIAAVVHGLIAAGQPFAQANALLARCAARAVLVARGADPDGLVPFEAAIIGGGRPKYVNELAQLCNDLDGTDASNRWARWIQWHSTCVALSAKHALNEPPNDSASDTSSRA